MVRYRRNLVPGGTYFFTVTLADRTSSALVDNVTALRMAFRIARHERPFTIEAIVILPEHLHAIWTLPSDDSDFSGRWKRIKAYFTHRLCCRRRGCQHLGGLFAVALRSVGLRPGGHRRPYLLFQNRYAQPRLLVTVDSLEFGFG